MKTIAPFPEGHMPEHADGFDGGETSLGRALYKLRWLQGAASPVARRQENVPEITRNNRFGYDGGQSRSWGFLRRS